MEILNPLQTPNWDNLLEATAGATFFHTSSWARVLIESYHYEPLYWANIENKKFTDLIPVMHINSILTGKRGVALPFTDFCPIISKKKMLPLTWTGLSTTAGKGVGDPLNSVTRGFFRKIFPLLPFIISTN